MDVALVQHAEDDVDDDERGRDQIRLAGQRRLEGLGVALEASTERGRHVEPGLRLFDRLYGLTQGDVRRQVEAQGYRGELPLMIDGQERGWRVCPFRERAQAHLLSGDRRVDVDPVERVLLQFRHHLLDHVIAVQLDEVLRDLARWPNASFSVSSISLWVAKRSVPTIFGNDHFRVYVMNGGRGAKSAFRPPYNCNCKPSSAPSENRFRSSLDSSLKPAEARRAGQRFEC